MFPLAGQSFPTNASELGDALRGALAEVVSLPSPAAAVSVEGDGFPSLERIAVDLSGAAVRATELPPKPVGIGAREPGVAVERLEVVGHPVRYEQAGLDLDLSAQDLKFDFDRDATGRPLLVLTDAADGQVRLKAGKKDLETALLAAAAGPAKAQGVAVQELELNLSSRGPRSASVDVRVKAKKLIVSVVLRASGRLDIDDELNATLSSLTCTGEGMIGGAAAAMIQPKLREIEGKQFSLMALSLGDVKLRDVQIDANDALTVTASFGRT